MFPHSSIDEESLAMQLVAVSPHFTHLQICCQELMDRRAFDVVKTVMSSPAALGGIFGSLALKYAERTGHSVLAENILNLITACQEETPPVNNSTIGNDYSEEIVVPRTLRIQPGICSKKDTRMSPERNESVMSASFLSQSQMTVDESFDQSFVEKSTRSFNPFRVDRDDPSASVDDFNEKVRRACESHPKNPPSKRKKKISAFDMWLSETGNSDSRGRAQLLAEFSKLSSDDKKVWYYWADVFSIGRIGLSD
ncbi:uncharacterized protein LOC115229349 [Octopus sinensis]|uniref:Uncharacterized protein LOC115229349 n=1 Tax=Octopus sinensis TaxID=2607531 RepID=A0A6P7TUY1_9MOLL|nr:uncharacterized protein LOC115229349 [Octopus sinensis]